MSATALEGLVAYLTADPTDELNTLIAGRVYGLELPQAQSASMPRNAVVLNLAGGPGSRDYVRIGMFRVDVWNYGENPIAALKVQRASHDLLKAIKHKEKIVSGSGVLLHNAIESSGPNYFKDPDTDWPVCIESWVVTASEVVTT